MDKNLILGYISMIAGKYLSLNILMHVLVIGTIITLHLNYKYSRFVFNSTVLILVSSVAILAGINGNPFNSITFGVLLITALLELIKGKNQLQIPAISIKTILLYLGILIGLWYPEFIKANPLALLFISPVGVIPCPTLTTVLAMLNLFLKNFNKTLYNSVTIIALFYGITGVFQLNVYFDIPLLIVALYSTIKMIKSFRSVKTSPDITQTIID